MARVLRATVNHVKPVLGIPRVSSAGRWYYASMVAALKLKGSIDIEVSEEMHGNDFELKTVVFTAKILKVMSIEKRLTTRGFDGPWKQFPEDRAKSADQLKAEFENRRAELLSAYSLSSFELAWRYIEMQLRRKTINRDFGSYGLKHRAEDLNRQFKLFPQLNDYVSNGVFIVAAIAAGVAYKRVDPLSRNAFFGLSSKSIRRTARGPLLTLSEKTRFTNIALASVITA